jgi:hypothetical protein
LSKSHSPPRLATAEDPLSLGQPPAWPRCTLFPPIRLQAFADRHFSPWLSTGFGYGWLQTITSLNNGAPNPEVNRNNGTAQFGAGVDIRTPIHILFPISLRAELRDHYAVNAANYGPHPFASRVSTI